MGTKLPLTFEFLTAALEKQRLKLVANLRFQNSLTIVRQFPNSRRSSCFWELALSVNSGPLVISDNMLSGQIPFKLAVMDSRDG